VTVTEVLTRDDSTICLGSVLEIVEQALAGHAAFGDSDYILEQFHRDSMSRLGAIADSLQSARELLDLLGKAGVQERTRVLGNTVVRSAIQHAQVRVAGDDYGLPLDDCDAIFVRSVQSLRTADSDFLFRSGRHGLPRLNSAGYHGWVWNEDYPPDVMSNAYRFQVKRNWHGILAVPRDEDLEGLERGIALLKRLMPRLCSSVLRHVHIIGIFDQGGSWDRKASSSTFTVGGTILLARSLLQNPWTVAEHILHEALHQKFYDFRHGHSLLQPESMKQDAPRICSPWNAAQLNDQNSWDIHRAFAAFHVYVQLAVLALIAEQESEEVKLQFGLPDGLTGHQKCFERAWYLGEQLKKQPVWSLLGAGGQQMIEWLQSVLSVLELPQPPNGAEAHLYLDLYWREARGVRIDETAPETLVGKLAALATDEIDSTRAILAQTGDRALSARFDEEIGQFREEEFAQEFASIREGIAWTLKNATADGYALKRGQREKEDPNALLRDMVLEGSRRLYSILHRIPDGVARAKRAAHRLGFRASCVDEVGRLLAMLAATIRSGGRILEIGTGTGAGIAWILSGLDGRADIEVVSIEADPELANAARQLALPHNATILSGDAAEMLPTLGMFDLIFLDASPFKHVHLDQCLALLAPRGALVVDDFHVGNANPTNPDAVQNKLRRRLLDHADLIAAELDYASGVVLATRVAA